MGIKDLEKRENKKDYDIKKKLSSLNNKERVESCTLRYEHELTTVDIYSEENNQIEEDSYPNIDKYNFYIVYWFSLISSAAFLMRISFIYIIGAIPVKDFNL